MTLPNDQNAANSAGTAVPANQQPATQPTGQSGQIDYQQAYTNLLAQVNDPNGPYVSRKSYVGLQQTLQEKHDAHQRADTSLSETNAQLANLQNQLSAVNGTTQTLNATNAKLQADLAAAQARVQRFELIGKDFPNLVQWEAQGILPQAPLDKLPELLSVISAQLGKNAQATTQSVIAGASALDTASASTVVEATAAAKLVEYNQAVYGGKTPRAELDKMWKEYQELKAKEAKK